jgi:chromosome segregation ATPase
MADAEAELDVTKTPAFAVLDELFQAGKVDQTRLEHLQSEYVKLHDAVLATYESEKELLRRGRQLKQDLNAERERLAATSGGGGAGGSVETLGGLEEEKQKAVGAATVAEEKDTMLRLQIEEYRRQKEELITDIEEAKRARAAEFEPFVRQLRKDGEELSETIAQQKSSITKMDGEKKDAVARIGELQEQIRAAAVEKLEAAAERRRVQSEPDKVAKQAEVVGNAKKTLQRELDKLEERVHEMDVTLQAQVHTSKGLESRSAELDASLDQQLAMSEEKQRVADDVRKRVAFAQAAHEDGLAEQVRLDVEMKGRQREGRREHEALTRCTKDKDAALRRAKKGEQELRLARDSLPPVERMLEACRLQQAEVAGLRRQQDAQLAELKREHEVVMYTFLKREKAEAATSEGWGVLQAEVAELQAQLTELLGEDRALAQEVKQLSAARELSSREASKVLRAFGGAMEELGVKDIYIGDLAKKKAEIGAKCVQYEKLYDVTKNERNKNVNLIQAASQGLAEWKEKIKILQNEVDILSAESIAKDVQLAKARLDAQGEVATRGARPAAPAPPPALRSPPPARALLGARAPLSGRRCRPPPLSPID